MASPRPEAGSDAGMSRSTGLSRPAANDAAIAAAVAPWLADARWFAAKGRSVGRIVVEEFAAIPGAGPGLALAILAIEDGGIMGESQRYAVPLEHGPLEHGPGGPATLVARDAALSPAFAAWLVATAVGGGSLRGRAGSFHGHPVPGEHVPGETGADAAAAMAAGPPEVIPVGGDASNTSFTVRPAGIVPPAGGRRPLIVKLLRRCRAGIQPEVEVGTLLAGQGGWRGKPRLLGWLEYSADREAAEKGGSTAIATVHELVPGCSSAWDRLVGRLSAGGMAGDAAGPILRMAAALGRTTAEMHRALASRGDLPDFAPEPMAATARHAAAERMAAHARRVFALAASRLPQLAGPLAPRVAAVIAAGERLAAWLESSADAGAGAVGIRVHGDYHLGQVLVGDGQAGERDDDALFVIDFEGEPGRPLAERRAKTSVFKDVAGMCRSFDYLLRHVARTTGRPSGPDDLHRLEASFLDAYGAVAAGQPWWPADPYQRRRLLDLYRLDKAVYELAYELDNRPDWVEVPLAAIEEMAAERD